jgi:hypothetical protein
MATTSSKVESAVSNVQNKRLGKDIVAGTKFAEAVVGQGDLGRMSESQDVSTAMDLIRQQAQGYSQGESLARREQAVEGLNTAQEQQRRRLQAALARAGVRGGVAGAQLGQQAADSMSQRANLERDLFLAGEQAKRAGAQNLFNTASEVQRFDLGQAAKEKNIALQGGLGFAQLGAAERSAQMSSEAQIRAAQAMKGAQQSGGGLLGGMFSSGGSVSGSGLVDAAFAPITAPIKAIGGVFCHTGDTKIRMANGTLKKLEDIKLNDEVVGGKVTCIGSAISSEEMYEFMGETMTASHLILTSQGYKKAKELGKKVADAGQVVYPMATEKGFYVTEADYISGDVLAEEATFGEQSMVQVPNYNEGLKLYSEGK